MPTASRRIRAVLPNLPPPCRIRGPSSAVTAAALFPVVTETVAAPALSGPRGRPPPDDLPRNSGCEPAAASLGPPTLRRPPIPVPDATPPVPPPIPPPEPG